MKNFRLRLKTLEKRQKLTPQNDSFCMGKSWLEKLITAGTAEIKEFERYLNANDVAAWRQSFKVYDTGTHDEKVSFTSLLSRRQLDLFVCFAGIYMWGELDDDPSHVKWEMFRYGRKCDSGFSKTASQDWAGVEVLLSEFGAKIPERDKDNWKAAMDELIALKSMSSGARWTWLTGQDIAWLERDGICPKRNRPTTAQLRLLSLFFENNGMTA